MPALRLERSQLVSSTDMARRFSEFLDRTRERGEPLFVTRNNSIEAVLLRIEDYELLKEYEELVEHLAVAKLIKARESEPEEVVDLQALLREEGLDPDELQKTDPD